MDPNELFTYTTSNRTIYATPPPPPDKFVFSGIEFKWDLSDVLMVLCKEISDLKKRVEELESLKEE